MLKSKSIQIVMVMLIISVIILAGCNSEQQTNVESEQQQTNVESEQQQTNVEISKGFMPEHNVELVIGANPGGGSDTLARVVSDYIDQNIIDPSILPENITGGVAAAPLNHFMKLPADGHSFMVITSDTIISFAKNETEYDIEDMIPIAAVQLDPAFLVIRADDERFSNIEEFLDYSKDNTLSIGGAHADGFDHIILNTMIDTTEYKNFTFVPYGGTGPAVTELLGGHIDAIIGRLPSFIGQVEAEQFKLIMSFTEERLDKFPDVPTSFENGIDVSGLLHRGFIVRKGTPANIVEFWENAVKEAIESDTYKVAYENSELMDGYLSSEDYQKLINDEHQVFVDYFKK